MVHRRQGSQTHSQRVTSCILIKVSNLLLVFKFKIKFFFWDVLLGFVCVDDMKSCFACYSDVVCACSLERE